MTQTQPSRALLLDEAMLHLDGVGPIAVLERAAASRVSRHRSELATGHLVSVFTYAATWPYRECHPDGDELAFVLSGEVDVLLDAGDGEHPTHARAGEACIVPAGCWHRLRLQRESTVLFVTPAPARTLHTECTP
jgi:mannose-6-phosphate isomerase-like protein (cupin superfamily)